MIKNLLFRVDEDVGAIVTLIVTIAFTHNLWFSGLMAVFVYGVLWIYTKPQEAEQIQPQAQSQPQAKLKPGQIYLNDTFKFNLLSDSIFISALKGYGKSVLLYNMLLQIHEHFTRKKVNVLLFDLKQTAFTPFKKSPFIVNNTIYTNNAGIEVLEKLLHDRQTQFSLIDDSILVDNLKKYHKVKSANQPYFPHIVVMIDEIQLFNSDDIERLNQVNKLGRSFGITFICATQRTTATISTNFISQFGVKIVGYMSDKREYKWAKLSDETISKMSAKPGLFAIGNKVIQTHHIKDVDVEKLAETFPKGTILTGSTIQKNLVVLDWFNTLNKKPLIEDIMKQFNCTKQEAQTYNKLWRKK